MLNIFKNLFLCVLIIISFFNISCRTIRVDMALSEYGLNKEDAANPSNIPVLIKILDDDGSYARYYAARALGNFGEKSIQAIPILIKRTNDRSALVRRNSVVSLSKLYKYCNSQTKSAIYESIALVADSDQDPNARKIAQYAAKSIYLNKIAYESSDISSEPQGQGTGFLLSKSGLIATNYHVIDKSREVKVKFPKIKKSLSASIVLQDKNNDIAILRLNNFNYLDFFTADIPYVIQEKSELKLGAEIYTIGYPLGDVLGDDVKASKGNVSSRRFDTNPTLFQISNPIQPGNSGGPLFNSIGEVIGIVVSTLNAKYFLLENGFVPQNVNFAIRVNYLLNLIEILPEFSEIKNRRNTLALKTIENQIKTIENFIVQVENFK